MPYFQFVKENVRWLAGGFLLAFFSSFGQTFFIAIWGGNLRAEFNLSHGDFGLLYMVATLASALTLPFIGRLVDLFPVPKIAVATIIALALTSLAMALNTSVILLFGVIYALRLFGQGMMTHISMTAMGRWYAENRGKAVSIATLGYQAGEATLPISFTLLAAAIGWRQSWMVSALIVAGIALPLIYLLMRVERIPLSRSKEATTDDTDLDRQWTRTEVIKDRLFWIAGLGVFAPAFIGTSIFFHQVYIIEVKGWTLELFTGSMVVMATTTAVFSLLAGIVIDRVNARSLLPIFLVPLGAGCLVLSISSAPWTIIVFMMLFGASYGFSSALFGALWPEIYGTRHLGAIRSIVIALMVLASAVGPGVTGLLIDWGVPFMQQLLYMAAYCFASAMVMFFTARWYSFRHSQQQLSISA